MRIVVHMLLYLECFARLFHLHADSDVQVFSLCCSLLIILAIDIKLWCISVLNELSLMKSISCFVNTLFNKLVRKFLMQVILALQVNHWSCLAIARNHEQRWNTCCLSHLLVISTEGWSDMNDTCTVLCGNIIARNNAERLVLHLNKLVVANREDAFWTFLCCLLNKLRRVVVKFL